MGPLGGVVTHGSRVLFRHRIYTLQAFPSSFRYVATVEAGQTMVPGAELQFPGMLSFLLANPDAGSFYLPSHPGLSVALADMSRIGLSTC